MDILNEYIPQHTPAYIGRRYLGALIDYIIYIGIYIVLVFSFGEKEIDLNETVTYSLKGWPAFLVIVGVWAVLRPIIEGINGGQTIGKAIVGIKVVKPDGSNAGFDNILARNFFDWVDFLPFFGILGLIVASGNKNLQRVGDMVGKTMVVDCRKQ